MQKRHFSLQPLHPPGYHCVVARFPPIKRSSICRLYPFNRAYPLHCKRSIDECQYVSLQSERVAQFFNSNNSKFIGPKRVVAQALKAWKMTVENAQQIYVAAVFDPNDNCITGITGRCKNNEVKSFESSDDAIAGLIDILNTTGGRPPKENNRRNHFLDLLTVPKPSK